MRFCSRVSLNSYNLQLIINDHLKKMITNVLTTLERDPLWATNESWTINHVPIIGEMHDFFRHVYGLDLTKNGYPNCD